MRIAFGNGVHIQPGQAQVRRGAYLGKLREPVTYVIAMSVIR